MYRLSGLVGMYYVTMCLFVPRRNKVAEGGCDYVSVCFRVGWNVSRDYVYFLWSPVPETSKAGEPVENKVLFQGKN